MDRDLSAHQKRNVAGGILAGVKRTPSRLISARISIAPSPSWKRAGVRGFSGASTPHATSPLEWRGVLTCVSVVVLLLGFVVLPSLSAAESSDEGWVVLFDGRNLDAWKMSPTAQWTVEEGAIVLRNRTDGSLKNEDYLWTKETFGNLKR